MAMPKMLIELSKHPEAGLLGYRQHLANPKSPMLVQYWRSAEHLEAYARQKDSAHFPAWVKFNKEIASNGDVSIWHETFKVRAGEYETVYNNMPPLGSEKLGNWSPRRAIAPQPRAASPKRKWGPPAVEA